LSASAESSGAGALAALVLGVSPTVTAAPGIGSAGALKSGLLISIVEDIVRTVR